jgi:hypothetical protein
MLSMTSVVLVFRTGTCTCDLSYLEGCDLSYLEGCDLSYLEGCDLSYLERCDFSYLEGCDLSYLEGCDLSYLEGCDLSYLEGCDLSYLEGSLMIIMIIIISSIDQLWLLVSSSDVRSIHINPVCFRIPPSWSESKPPRYEQAAPVV